ncbi:MAG: prolyl oligopeptidase family serine peptidase [Pseudomonadota bacterium]
MTIDLRPTRTAPDDDPYLWLEDVDGADAVAWVDARTDETRAAYASAAFTRDRDAVLEILNASDKIPHVTRRGAHLYNFWRDSTHVRGIWRRTSYGSFVGGAPDWHVVLDIDALAQADDKDWVWQGAHVLSGTHDRAMIRLSRGGGDAVEMREFDLAACAFVDGGFALPEAKGTAGFADADTLLVAIADNDDHATASGYARTVRRWRRGERWQDADVIAETDREAMALYVNVVPVGGARRVWFTEILDFFSTRNRIGTADGPTDAIDLPGHVRLLAAEDWFTASPREAWEINGTTYPADTLLAGRMSDLIAGRLDVTPIFTPGRRRTLGDLGCWNGDGFVLSIEDDLQPTFEIARPTPDGWDIKPVPFLPRDGTVTVWPLDGVAEETDGTFCLQHEDPLIPPTLSFFSVGEKPTPVHASPARFDAEGLRISRHEATSTDGEKIPYVVIGPEQQAADATPPVLMYGYGGFGVQLRPYYDAVIGKLWLERGGIRVLTHLRGGGEFGQWWHDAGRHAGKALSHDDFAAIAKDIADRGISKPERIAGEGGSNGGILITNMLTRYPERFGALWTSVPLVDMRRYHRLLAGASWIAEYGDPDSESDWDWLAGYSAYHNAEPNPDYPPILICTARRDDRVHPGHARKMAAKLRALGAPVAFHEPASGGHGAVADNTVRAELMALGIAFVARNLGIDQQMV